MTELVPQSQFATGERFTILTPNRKAVFLESLAQFGNVRVACRAATISAQTAYRARRRSAAFAQMWDAALLAARVHVEGVLGDRAVNGVEEAVYYHGEEVARRRRYDTRLLLAHLGRLDRLAERADLSGTVAVLDDRIDALREGRELDAIVLQAGAQEAPEEERQDSVPCVPSCRVCGEALEADEGPDCETCAENGPCGAEGAEEGGAESGDGHDGACRDEDGTPPGPDDPMWLENRLARMEAARPRGAQLPTELVEGEAGWAVEDLQLEAFEAGLDEWWLVTSEEELDARLQ
ncbi:hypothetical protein [Parerythrobacter jejuensis]|uniref:Uncharacterized protein n=1 Tax=Parerythrobacter jejuensis TaxID=795812 RepID=A0A845AT65_9SPHN|nr:hypothetical protein [Parerythrobacter jejuensis]MXP32689.1 hypothetical protein [Parerythrobacter jejuensis]